EVHMDVHGGFGLNARMCHGYKVTELAEGFHTIASTPTGPMAAIGDEARRYYGVQFHPEVTHTKQGGRILSRFLLEICGCEALWTPSNIVEDLVEQVRAQVRSEERRVGKARSNTEST